MTLRLLISVLVLSLIPLCSMPARADELAKARNAMLAGDDVRAVGLLRGIVKRDADNDRAWFMLGVVYTRREEFNQAIAAFRRVIELRPELAEPHHNLAVIYYRLGDLPAAARELEAAADKQPGNARTHEQLGDLYVRLARRHYRQALKLQPSAAIRARYEQLLRVLDVHRTPGGGG